MSNSTKAGDRHGYLVAVERATNAADGHARWVCLCDCGKTTTVTGSKLRQGQVRTCGCGRSKFSRERVKHGRASLTVSEHLVRTYRSWTSMRRRCLTPTNIGYSHYGGRGIRICERWSSFENFLADMGERPPGRTLDRVNVDGNYERDNCRWATVMEQNSNRRDRRPQVKP
jgi:hypothetical protein